MALADALGCTWGFSLPSISPIFDLELTLRFLSQGSRQRQLQIAESVQKTQKTLATTPFQQRTQTKPPLAMPRRCLRRQRHPIRVRTKAPFSRPCQTSMRNSQRYIPRSLRERPFPFFSGHSDPRSMSALAARRSQYHASQNQNHGTATSTSIDTAGTDVSVPLQWSTADDRALEEAVVRARVGLLFAGFNS
jgi:hypothetical protein